jgi:hypothetical protein
MQKLSARWGSLDRGAKISCVGLLVLLAAAVGVRLWLIIGYPPAFLGYPDSSQYTLAALTNIFRDPGHPGGYPFFLRLVHHLSDRITLVIALQHLMGIATGLLYYKAVRRTGAPPWLGLLPAAVVFFGGTGLFLEHSLLSDSLFTFLQAVAIYAAVRALYEPAIRWSLIAGAALGLSSWVRTAGISIAVLVPVVLLWAAPGRFPQRLRRAVASALVVAAMTGFYIGSQYYFTGFLGEQRQDAWNLYGRVATFVDCSAFTPPSGTRFLCPTQPLGHRESPYYYQEVPAAPAPKAFGPPWVAPTYANAFLEKFSVAAIEHEPIAYVGSILPGLSRYVFPRSGEGETPDELLAFLTSPEHTSAFQPIFESYFAEGLGYDAANANAELRPLDVYQSITSIQGPLIILLLIAAIVGTFFLAARIRVVAILFTLTAIATITFSVAGSQYSVRYTYPTYGPLAAGAALGAWGIGSRLAGILRRRGQDRQVRRSGSRAKTHAPVLD